MDLTLLAEIIENRCQLTKNQVILAGISGGPDSLCLLDVLQRLGYSLIVAHYNHRLRPEASADARVVEAVCASRGVPFVLGEGDVQAYARERSLSIEEAARLMRYQFLFSQARKSEAQAVAVGHTADDQVETVLMHILRGAGLAGLKGMAYRTIISEMDADIPLVRPLLGVWREETEKYCAERNLQPVQDLTNFDTAYRRNRIRHEVIPYLEQYNPRFRQAIWRMAQTLADDYEIVQSAVSSVWEKAVVEKGRDYLAFDQGVLAGAPEGVLRWIWRRAMASLRAASGEVDYTTVEQAIGFVEHPPASGRAELAAGLRLTMEGGKLYLTAGEIDVLNPSWPQVPKGGELELRPNRPVALLNGWQITCELVRLDRVSPGKATFGDDLHQAWVDGSRVRLPFIVRSRRRGERFRPLGMDGHSLKLSDFFINVKLPRRARDSWPLVCSNDEIVWVAGYRLAHPWRLTEDTREVYHLRLIKGF